MKIKVTPLYDNSGPAEKLEFARLLQRLEQMGYATLLLHFSDESVLIRRVTQQELVALNLCVKCHRRKNDHDNTDHPFLLWSELDPEGNSVKEK